MIKINSKLLKFSLISLFFLLSLTTITLNRNLDMKNEKNLGVSSSDAPILFTSNSDLTTYPNKTGFGNETQPYIIRDLVINANFSGSCIELRNINLYLEIVNCTLFNSGSSLISSDSGIEINNCQNIKVKNSTVINNSIGLYITGSTFCEFSELNVTNNSISGIWIQSSSDCIIKDNVIMKSGDTGILLSTSESNLIMRNKISNNSQFGIEVDQFSSDNQFYFNNILNNTNGQAVDDGLDNQWDNGIIGNLWGDYVFKYPSAQNDGILWDSPYDLNGNANSKDYYPIFDTSGTHAPISLLNNTQLDNFCDGNGTTGMNWSDAHVIEDFKISANGGKFCLNIQNTDRYLIIKNCTFIAANLDFNSHGIHLKSSRNIHVVNCTMKYNYHGVKVETDANRNNFTGNIIINNGFYGIWIDNAHHNLLINNTIANKTITGIGIYNTLNATINNNSIQNNNINGILLQNSNNCSIFNSFINNNMNGLVLYDSDHVVIENNSFWNNEYRGINVRTNSYNTTINNNTISNETNGIELFESNSTIVTNNTLYNSSLLIDGYTYLMVTYIIEKSNLINGKPIIFNHSQNEIPSASFQGAGQIILVNCTKTSIENYTNEKGSYGIILHDCINITIHNCSLQSFYHAIRIKQNQNLTFTSNILDNCSFGIWLSYIQNILFSQNQFLGCGIWVEDCTIENFSTFQIDNTNFVNGKQLYYYYNQTNLQVSQFQDAGQIILINCNESIIEGEQLNNGTVGVYMYYSSNNTIQNCFIQSNSKYGVYLENSNENNIINCSIIENEYGAYIKHSNNSFFKQNEFNQNNYGIDTFLSGNSTIINNIFNENDAIGLSLYGNGYYITNNTFNLNYVGIELYECDFSNITANILYYSNITAILMENSEHNTIIENRCYNNTEFGILLENSVKDNIIYHNSFWNNSFSNAYCQDYYGTNTWHNGTEGNYWDDYKIIHPEASNDGRIWNETYVINGSSSDLDPYPLIQKYEPDYFPSFDFSADQTEAYTNITIQFNITGNQGNAPVNYQWDFGDGSENATIENPIHSYNTTGSYTVILTILDVDGDRETVIKQNYITCTNTIPTATFSANQTYNLVGYGIQFNFIGEGMDIPLSFSWDFGDGSNSTAINPVHHYSYDGLFTVMLTVEDANGDETSYTIPNQIRILNNAGDYDGDGLTNFNECMVYGTNPTILDTDEDGINDGIEVNNQLKPTEHDANKDYDKDGLLNYEEVNIGTNPLDADSDDDGYQDGIEISLGMDPLNPFSSPTTLIILPIVSIVASIIIILFIILSRKKKARMQSTKYFEDEQPGSTIIDKELSEISKDMEKRIIEKRSMLTRVYAPQREKNIAKVKKKKNIIEEKQIKHEVDPTTEKEVEIIKKKENCIVCNKNLKGTSYICPYCETKYCIRCAIALSERSERCWTCKEKLKFE